MFEQIPAELKSLRQWCNFDVVNGKKLPFISGNCAKASSNNESTWRTFEEAVADIESGKRQHLGFALSESDPYFFIDLDEEHPEIVAAVPTYTQRSVSGKGIHLIGRGSFEGEGTHPSAPAIGMYQERRFVLFTGDCIGETEILPVDSETLQGLYNWISGNKKSSSTTDLVEEPQSDEDAEVFERCKKRFDTFLSLYEGNAGPDHSESDHALIAMLADETQSNEQVRRMFIESKLCRPKRANAKYIDYSLQKIRSEQKKLEAIFMDVGEEHEEESPTKIPDLGSRNKIDSMPNGLIKDIADWIWRQSKFPLQEAAIGAAFSIISTVAGRAYQIKDSGLNTWIVLLAGTGVGKNEFPSGISKVIRAVSSQPHYGGNFDQLFQGELASGPAVEDILAITNRCFCYFPEFDDIFKKLCAKDVQPHHGSLKKALLNSFMISGKGHTLSRRLKAKAKGDDNSIQAAIESPCLVVGGETTIEGMYGNLTTAEVKSGFLQRFTMLQAEPSSISRRTSPEWRLPFPEKLAAELLEFFTHCENLGRNNEFEFIKFSGDTEEQLDDYDHSRRDLAIDGTHLTDAVKEFYTRAGIKASRYAGLFAVSQNWRSPAIDEEMVFWSTSFVDETDEQVIDRLSSGNMGGGQAKQETEILRVITETLNMSPKKKMAAGINKKVAFNKRLIPHNWLKRKLITSSAFTNDRNGEVTAFERAVNTLVHNGILLKKDSASMESEYGKGCGAMLMYNS